MELKILFKAVVEFMSMGKDQKINIYTQAVDLDAAIERIDETVWVEEKHGHIVSVSEVAGVWVE